MGVPSYIECRGEDCQIASDEQRDTIFHAVANAGYAYRLLDALRPQLTVTLQNHPSNDEAFISSAPDAEIEHGPRYATVALVIEWQPVEWLGVAPAFQWPLTRSPIEYGPIIGFGVRGIWPGQLQALE